MSHFDGSSGRAFAVAGLQHIKLAFFDGELDILHVFVVRFQSLDDLTELLIDMRHVVRQLFNALGGPNAGDDVFALGIH